MRHRHFSKVVPIVVAALLAAFVLGTSALALPTAYDGTAGRHPDLHEQDGHSEARHWDDGRHRRRELTTALR